MSVGSDSDHEPEAAEVEQKPEAPQTVGVSYPAVARVASRSALQMVRLRSAHAECTTRPESVPRAWDETAFVGFRATVAQEPSEDGVFRSEVSFVALFDLDKDLNTVGLDGIEDDDEPDVVVDVSFELEYTLSPDAELQEDDLDQFALANSTLHAWPYWRELAQSLSMRMGIPPLVIGTYKMPYAHDPAD